MSESKKSQPKTIAKKRRPRRAAKDGAAPAPGPRPSQDFIVRADDGVATDESFLEPQRGRSQDARAKPVEIFSRAATAIARVGQAWEQSEEILGRWLDEAQTISADLEKKLAGGDLQGLGRDVCRMREVLSWMDKARDQALRHASFARRGFELRDTAAIVRDAARSLHVEWADIDIQLPPLSCFRSYCRPLALSQAFELAMRAVARRIGGAGSISIEVELGSVFLLHHIQAQPASPALGDASLDLPGHWVERLRHLIVDVHHGRILPGAGGPSAASMTIAIPRLDPN